METTYEKVRALRKDKADSPADVSFKKAVVGGYECREVDDYIQSLRNISSFRKGLQREAGEYVSTWICTEGTGEIHPKDRRIEGKPSASRNEPRGFGARREAGERWRKKNRAQEQLGKLRKETENNAQTKQKIDDYEKEIERLKKINYEAMEQIRETDQSAMDENRELRELVDRLQREMDDSIQSQRTIDEMNTVMADNARLTEEVCSLSEKKDRLNLQNDILIGEVNKIEKANHAVPGKRRAEEKRKRAQAVEQELYHETASRYLNSGRTASLASRRSAAASATLPGLGADESDLCEFSKKFEE
jgi:predicted transcriptional regulator